MIHSPQAWVTGQVLSVVEACKGMPCQADHRICKLGSGFKHSNINVYILVR